MKECINCSDGLLDELTKIEIKTLKQARIGYVKLEDIRKIVKKVEKEHSKAHREGKLFGEATTLYVILEAIKALEDE